MALVALGLHYSSLSQRKTESFFPESSRENLRTDSDLAGLGHTPSEGITTEKENGNSYWPGQGHAAMLVVNGDMRSAPPIHEEWVSHREEGFCQQNRKCAGQTKPTAPRVHLTCINSHPCKSFDSSPSSLSTMEQPQSLRDRRNFWSDNELLTIIHIS